MSGSTSGLLQLKQPDPTAPNGLLGPLAIKQPDQDQPDQGSALADLYDRVSDYISQQQQKSADMGLWTGGGLLSGGHPTAKGVADAAKQYGSGLLFGTTAPEGSGITAYHGSPYSFDQFSTANIGAGEGAQAYGHGLYFAENEATAKAYRDALAEGVSPGSMYEVNIGADPEHMLDWDKPLNQQSQHVQDVLAHPRFGDPDPEQTGGSFIRGEHEGGDPSEVSARLRDAGIPGIKYLDAGSRGQGQGTHNYVVFNDNILNILRKYGIAGLGIGLGAGATQQGRQSQ